MTDRAEALAKALEKFVSAADELRGAIFPDDYRHEIDNARAALEAYRSQPSGWRDMSSAPKDGSMFLGWVAAERWSSPDGEGSGHAHDTSQVDFCWWRPVEESPDGGYFDNASGQIGDGQEVIRWMPLPAAPSTTPPGESK
jgi:hypothetical protein